MLLREPICEICGLPQVSSGLCVDCLTSRPPFRALRSWVAFDGPIRRALHCLKYRRDVGLGDVLAASLSVFVISQDWPIDLVVPIPLSRQRLLERGYNQASLIAYPLSLALGWQYIPKALTRTRHTRSQVGLTAGERKDNMRGAYWAERKYVHGKTVLLIDDVATTGATLSSAAGAMVQAGAAEVYCLTLARALPRHGLQVV
jgi:competence protein ComFC